jgi:hypothetical protein
VCGHSLKAVRCGIRAGSQQGQLSCSIYTGQPAVVSATRREQLVGVSDTASTQAGTGEILGIIMYMLQGELCALSHGRVLAYSHNRTMHYV